MSLRHYMMMVLATSLIPASVSFGQPLVPQEKPAAAAPRQDSIGVGFELATRMLSAADARISGGSNVFRLQFRADPSLILFHHQENMSVSFKNTGTGAQSVVGTAQIEGIGVQYVFREALRFELMQGRASVNINDGNLSSSDAVTDIGISYTYRGEGRAFVDAGISARSLKLSGAVAGNVVDGTAGAAGATANKKLDSLGGTLLHLGIGFAF